jgi:uncharacterized protein YkwD
MNRISILLLVAGLLLVGCMKQTQQTVVAPPPGGPGEAAVNVVEVLYLPGEKPDVRIVVTGALPDGCARLKETEIERVGRLFTITLPITWLSFAPCSPDPVPFERVVRLIFDPAAGPVDGKFGLLVNGQLQSFDVPAVRAETPSSINASETIPTPTGVSAAITPEPAVTTSAAAPTEPPAVVTPLPEGKVTLGPSTGPSDCNNKAAFFEDVTIPAGTSLEPGTSFVKTWKVRNEGTCTWGPGYQLLLVEGDPLGAPAFIPLTAAAPQEVVQISVQMTAPKIAGSYLSAWGFVTPEGQSFGVGSAGLYPLSFKVGVRQPPLADVGCEAEFSTEYELRILELMNAERASRGLPHHELNEALSNVARAHSFERGCLGVHSHNGADGKSYEVRVKRAEIAYKWINEIIYNGNFGPKPAVQWWVYQSALHHEIVMAKKYTSVGIGYAKTGRGANKEYFTVLFMTP